MTIPARQADGLSDEDLRGIELEENTERESLSDYAATKARLAVIRQDTAMRLAKEKEAGEKEAAEQGANYVPTRNESRPHRTHRKTGKRRTGRPKEAGSKQDVAEETGVSHPGRRRMERHEELAEKFPFMQKPGWILHNVLEAGLVLDKLSEKDQQMAGALLDQPAIPPKTAIEILTNLVEMPAERRKNVGNRLLRSDCETRVTAAVRAPGASVPPVARRA